MPKSVVKAVVGRDGANLDEVAEATGCTVRDAKEDSTYYDDETGYIWSVDRTNIPKVKYANLVFLSQSMRRCITSTAPGCQVSMVPTSMMK